MLKETKILKGNQGRWQLEAICWLGELNVAVSFTRVVDEPAVRRELSATLEPNIITASGC